MKNKKLSISEIVAAIILLTYFIGGGIFAYNYTQNHKNDSPKKEAIMGFIVIEKQEDRYLVYDETTKEEYYLFLSPSEKIIDVEPVSDGNKGTIKYIE